MVGFLAEEVKLTFRKKTQEEKRIIAERKVQQKARGVNGEVILNYLPKYDKPWYKVPHLVRLNLLILIISLASTNTGYDGSLLNGFQSIPDWLTAMHSPSGAVLGAISSGPVFGLLISVTFAPWLCDTYGRRHSVFVGNIFLLVGSIVQSCSDIHKNGATSRAPYAQFLMARIILGVGVGLTVSSCPSLIAELSYPTHRQICTAFYNSNWYLGAIVSGWVTFGTREMSNNWSWRIPSIIQGFFPLLQMLLIYLVPESPRYLISKGLSDQARAILLKHHAGGNEEEGGALVDFEMSEIELAIEQEKIADNYSYSSLFKTPGNRKRMFIAGWLGIMMQLSGNGLVSYYLSKVLASIGITSTNQQLVFNGGLMIYNFGISIIVNLTVSLFPRRIAFISSISCMLTSFIIWTILSAINQKRNFEDKSLGKGVMAMIFLYYISYNFGLNGLPFVYLTEVLPFTIRAKGINFCFLIQEIGQAYNGFVNPIAMDAIEWKYYIVFCCILFVELIVVYLTFEETIGRTLEEVAEVFGEKLSEEAIENVKSKARVTHLEVQESFTSTEKVNHIQLV